MQTCIILGGTGYIGTKLTERFSKEKRFDKIFLLDLNPPSVANENVEYFHCDVRKPIKLDIGNIDPKKSWIFNLAAIHREPGHLPHEYFDTNINGAENINSFAESTGIKNIFFTSSIAPYGRSVEMKTESSPLYSETPYGISKGYCEKIHQIWLERGTDRRLIICRPSVIYGPGDPGNVLRMIRGVKNGTFFFPGEHSIIKAYGYIYGLLDSIEFVMSRENEKLIIYNYAENPVLPIGEMVKVIKKFFGISRPTLKMPLNLLCFFAAIIQILSKPVGINCPIHPVRVRKAAFPTNVRPQYLIENGFEFNYGFERSLEHWNSISPEDFK